MNSSDNKEFRRLQKAKLKAQASGKLKEEAELCNVLGELLSRYGEYEEAIKEHQQELRLSDSLQDVIGAAVANRKIGECYSQLGHFKKALRHQGRHLELARAVESHVEEQRARATIGRTFLFQGESMRQDNPDEAVHALQKARDSFLKSLEVCGLLKGMVSDKELMEMKARLYLNIGLVYDYQGDNANSAKFIKQAIFIAEKHQLLEDLYRSHCSQGDIYLRTGEGTKALRSFENAMKVAKRLKDKSLESDALSSSANVFIQLGDFHAAKRALKKAYKLGSQKPEDKELVIRTLKAAIRGCRLQEELEEVGDVAYRERLPLYESLGDLCSKVSAFARAAVYYQKQLSCALALKCSTKELAPIYVSLATTYADDGRHGKAIEMYRKELELRKGHPKEEGKTWLNIADYQERSKEPFETINQSYKTALEFAKKAQHPKLQLLALKSMGLLQQKHKQELLYGSTVEKIHHLKEQHDIASEDEDEISDEEGDGEEEGEGLSESWEVDELELSESDESEVEEEYDRSSAAQRARKTKFAKRNEKGETLLHRACIDGNVRQVKKLLQQGHPVNPRDYCGWIPLHEACNFGHVDIVEALIDHGADINDRGGDGCSGITPLHDAINGGNFEVAELLVAKGANIHAKDDKGMNAANTLSQWMETYASDLDQATRQDAERMATTLQQATRKGNPKSSQPRPRPALDNTDLFDRDDGPSQVAASRPHQLAGTSGSFNSFETGSGRNTASARDSRRSLDGRGPTPSRSRQRTSLLRRNVGRISRYDVEDDGDCFETLAGAEREEDSDEAMEISQDAMPVMTSHSRARGMPGQHQTSTRTGEASDIKVGRDATHVTNSGNDTVRSKHGDHVSDEDSYDIEDDDVNICPLQNNRSAPEVDVADARHAYMSAMSSIGSAATRISHCPAAANLSKSKPANDGPALIPEEEYTGGDDWLVQDVTTQPSKRKRMDVDYMFRKADASLPGTSSPGPSTSQLRASQKPSSLSRRSKRSRQLKLTNMGTAVVSRHSREERRVPSPLLEEEDSRPDSEMEFSQMQDLDEARSTSRHPEPSQDPTPRGDNCPTIDQHPPTAGAVMRVRVKIQDKTFLIPVREVRDMSWLCEEASKRYFTSCGLRPKLVLCTGEGAMFSPEDSITDLLNNNEEVIGKVESWDLPPLTERYKRACQTAKTGEHPKIRGCLQLTQSTPGILDLSNAALSPTHLTPLFLALQCQYSLRKLLLPGNRFADSAVPPLVAALESLPNLAVLDLSCNGISPEGLKLIQEGLSQRSGGMEALQGLGNPKPLQLLEMLNLSYNPLTDASAPYLAALISHCSLLAELSLTSCDLTAKLFQLHRRALTEAFQGSSNLRTLRVSHNALGSTGVELFLRCLTPDLVSSLDLSCVISSAVGSNLTKHLSSYLSQPDCSLKDLHLSGCHLSDNDILDMTRCLSVRNPLASLDLSANPHLTEVSICPLLQTIANSSSSPAPLESLDLSGCGFQTPLSTDFLARLSLHLVKDSHKRAGLKRLRMCGNQLSKTDFELLIAVWEDAHGDAAMHNVDSVRCEFDVRE
ncbi:tonsoku-like protein [Patiria miniata]|uniref:Tonsoku-like protein n=1 Tax=Patiria miniata TaxID=46514 RepID=A0A914BJL9_PATMI|nr:tonsoku-like protein [Patiria miniata]